MACSEYATHSKLFNNISFDEPLKIKVFRVFLRLARILLIHKLHANFDSSVKWRKNDWTVMVCLVTMIRILCNDEQEGK